MDYTERTKQIATWLHGLLHRYKPPPEYDIATQRHTLDLFVTDINSRVRNKITADQLSLLLEKVDSKIRTKQSSRIWPTNKMFIEATIEASNDFASVTQLTADTFSLDPLKITEKRIKNGQSISDSYLKDGVLREKLLSFTSITAEDLRNYEVDTLND